MGREVAVCGWSFWLGTPLNRTVWKQQEKATACCCSPPTSSHAFWCPVLLVVLVVVPDGSGGNICTDGRHMSLSTRCYPDNVIEIYDWQKYRTNRQSNNKISTV